MQIKNSRVANISSADFGIFWDMAKFLNLDKIYIKKNDNDSFITCPKCNRGNLRFDIDYFLENSQKIDWEARYNCTNSPCSNQPSLSEIKTYDAVKKSYFFEEKERLNYDKLLKNQGIEMAEVARKQTDNHYDSNTFKQSDRIAIVGGKYGSSVH